MAVTLTKQQALRIIADISAILPRKCRIPVLGHVLFESGEDGSVRVTATDLEQTLTTRIAGASDGDPVRFLLPVSELKSLKSMPTGGTVTFKSVADDSVLCTVSGGDHSFSRTIATMPASEFPETSVDAELAECDLGAFLRVFRATAFAASSDPARVVINSVYADPERQALVATDGRRLTIRPLADFPLPGDAILPLTRMLLKRIPEEANGRIGVHDDENDCQTLVIDTGELIYSCKCPEGIYPNYRQVIPETVGYTASFSFGAAGLEAMESL
ncbi:MAG: hypothetical protein KAI66_26195, partial [Lentisphaeria bacterium]|nr:hypothetical protein [Lentisphaeria bacterium]